MGTAGTGYLLGRLFVSFVDEIREALDYDKDSGVITWKKCGRPQYNGKEAGGIVHKACVYRRVVYMGRTYTAHRVAFMLVEGRWPNPCIDHINGDKLDNRWENLREATYKDNNRNARLYPANKTGVAGVRYRVMSDRINPFFEASIVINNKHIHLGCYGTLFEAACARKSAEIQHGFHPNHGRRR